MAQVTIYTKTVCPYCTRARSLFTKLGAPFVEVNLENDHALRAELMREHNWRTVPMIVVNGRFLGGFDDVSELHANGGLAALLSEAAPVAG